MIDVRRYAEWAQRSGKGVRVALLDSGVDTSHPDFVNKEIVLTDLTNPASDGRDSFGHGTQCASLILQVAPDCSLFSGKIMGREGEFTVDSLLGGLFWASKRKADIICICTGERDNDPDVEQRIRQLSGQQRLVLAAIGNLGKAGPGAGVYPARFRDAIAMGSALPSGELALFTDVPDGIDLFCLGGTEFQAAEIGGGRQPFIGTSATTSLMAGILALYVSKLGEARSGINVREKLLAASDLRQSARGKYFLVDAERLLTQAP